MIVFGSMLFMNDIINFGLSRGRLKDDDRVTPQVMSFVVYGQPLSAHIDSGEFIFIFLQN